LIICFLTLASCQKSVYEAVTYDGNTFQKAQVQRNKEVLIIDTYFKNDLDANIVVQHINQNRLILNDPMFSEEEEMGDFINAIFLMRKKKYADALSYLENLEDSKYDYQVRMLELDCYMELKKSLNYLSEYQKIYDRTSNETVGKILKERFKFARYEN